MEEKISATKNASQVSPVATSEEKDSKKNHKRKKCWNKITAMVHWYTPNRELSQNLLVLIHRVPKELAVITVNRYSPLRKTF